MCTAINLKSNDYYFGRNLDLDISFNEQVCIVPRNYKMEFKKIDTITTHYAFIGMASVVNNVPLFYDATNEYGVSMAGLAFPINTFYNKEIDEKKNNIAPFELIPYILGTCRNLNDVKKKLSDINIVDIPFNEYLPNSALHFIISYKKDSIVIESMKDGLHIHESKLGILTNEPSFDKQIENLNNYRYLSNKTTESKFSKKLGLVNYCEGLSTLGLPGDTSSTSRFVRMAFNKTFIRHDKDEKSSVNAFFHLLNSVERLNGCCISHNNKYDYTIYSSCMNTDKGLYYYTTYNNHQIHCVNMHNIDLNRNTLALYKLVDEEQIYNQN